MAKIVIIRGSLTRMVKDRRMVIKYFKMVTSIKVNGLMILRMVKASLFKQRVNNMRASGKTIN